MSEAEVMDRLAERWELVELVSLHNRWLLRCRNFGVGIPAALASDRYVGDSAREVLSAAGSLLEEEPPTEKEG